MKLQRSERDLIPLYLQQCSPRSNDGERVPSVLKEISLNPDSNLLFTLDVRVQYLTCALSGKTFLRWDYALGYVLELDLIECAYKILVKLVHQILLWYDFLIILGIILDHFRMPSDYTRLLKILHGIKVPIANFSNWNCF